MPASRAREHRLERGEKFVGLNGKPLAGLGDTVGDRWTFLLIRELLSGPKRYTDLRDGLPGIPTDVLAARLRDLEAQRVVERQMLPPPAASKVYQLTEDGAALEPVLIALARWGRPRLPPPSKASSGPSGSRSRCARCSSPAPQT